MPRKVRHRRDVCTNVREIGQKSTPEIMRTGFVQTRLGNSLLDDRINAISREPFIELSNLWGLNRH